MEEGFSVAGRRFRFIVAVSMGKPAAKFVLCFDFDGTMVLPEADPIFHPALGQMIKQLRAQGAAWVVNTGRTLEHTLHGLAQYGLFMEPDYLIVRECDVYRPGLLRRWTDFGSWNREARRAHRRFVREHKAFFEAVRTFLAEHTESELLEGDHGDIGIVSASISEMDRICEWIEAQRPANPDIGYQRNTIYLRFAHTRYSKGTALGELSRLLQITPAQVFAAGDNFNDLSMLDPLYAGQIACPANALPPIKTHVRGHGGYLASRPASEGMIQALAHFFGGAPAVEETSE
jgi:hydroxymethylpyrimidine pyrophosphatase-like HAD family hydrolase